uniref:Putative secreted protein n=1 Tax=Ixodes ricinus TaxID=34613 RepID=V5HAP1_IXORI
MLAWKVAICLLGTAAGAMFEEAYVYPRILEERASDGLKLVTIDGKTTLRLEKASVLAETLLVTSYDENGQMTHTLTGMVDALTRIEPVLTVPRSLDGSLPHRLHTMAGDDLERLKKIAAPIKPPMASLLTPRSLWVDPN